MESYLTSAEIGTCTRYSNRNQWGKEQVYPVLHYFVWVRVSPVVTSRPPFNQMDVTLQPGLSQKIQNYTGSTKTLQVVERSPPWRHRGATFIDTPFYQGTFRAEVFLETPPTPDRPDDLVDYDEAGRLVDRSKSAVRWWVRNNQLQSWLEEEGNPQSKRMVSKAALLAMVVQSGKSAHPGGPGRGAMVVSPPPQDPGIIIELRSDLRVKTAELEGARSEVAALRVALEAERARVSAVEERAELERLRSAEWKDRAEALSAELNAVRAAAGLPWWRRLLA